MADPVVAVGFLTRRDLDSLGTAFINHFPVEHEDVFADILTRLDRVEASPFGRGVVLRASNPR